MRSLGEFTEAELTEWGRSIGSTVETPVVFALRGELGAGKSVLARAIARGAGIQTAMPSPTFNLLFEYENNGRVVEHLDLYRLEDPDEVWELGWHDLGTEEQIVIIEWPERAEALLPEPRWEILIEPHESDPLKRIVSATPVGDPPGIPQP